MPLNRLRLLYTWCTKEFRLKVLSSMWSGFPPFRRFPFVCFSCASKVEKAKKAGIEGRNTTEDGQGKPATDGKPRREREVSKKMDP